MKAVFAVLLCLSTQFFTSYKSTAQVANDIGVSAIDSPLTLFCGSSQQIYARVTNYGNNRVDSFVVNWSMGGVMQTPVKRVITLDTTNGSGSTFVSVLLGNYTFAMNVPVAIKAWTTVPNAQADPVNTNDTTTVSRTAISMKGVYSIDPLGSGPANFTTIDAAVSALTTYGICGPTVFNIAAGAYPRATAITIGNIAGTNTINTITFKGSGQSSCIITGSIDASGVIIANQSKYITFRDLSVINNSTDNPCAIAAVGATNKVWVINCSLKVPSASGSSGGNVINYTANATGASRMACQADSVRIDSNTISGGYIGLSVYGAANSSRNRNIVVNNNTIGDVYSTAIHLVENQNAIRVSNNIVTFNTSAPYTTGIYFSDNRNYDILQRHVISGNRIYGFTSTGINCSYHRPNTVNGLGTLIANNVLTGNNMESSGSISGIVLRAWDNDKTDVYHNTVAIKGLKQFASTDAAFYSLGSTQINVKNNIFAVYGGLIIPAYTTVVLTANRLNNNLYYHATAGSNLVRIIDAYYHAGNFSGTLTGGDSSYAVIPPFVNLYATVPDVALRHGCLFGTNAGSLVANDVKENIRAAKPTIGAYEYELQANNVSVLDIINPSLIQPTVSGLMDFKFRVINSGNNLVNNYLAHYRKNSGTTNMTSKGASIQPCGIDTLVFSGAGRITIEDTQNLLVYTSNPNNNTDPERTGDTLRTVINASLKGTYTVGGTSPDFATPALAAAAVMEKGLWGHVVFNIRPGTYGPVKISGPIAGMSDTATITFDGNNAPGCIISGDTITEVFLIEKVKYVTVSNLTIKNTRAASSSNAAISIFSPVAARVSSCRILNCIISMPVMSAPTGSACIQVKTSASTSAASCDSLLIEGNVISGGGHGITFTGGSDSSMNKGIVIRNNQVLSCTNSGMYLYRIYNPVTITNNTIRMKSETGIAFTENVNYTYTSQHKITHNRIYNFSTMGIYCSNSNMNSSVPPILIVNNEVICDDASNASHGIYLQQKSNCHARVYHNTVIMESPMLSTATFSAFYNAGSDETIVKNNIFMVNKGGHYPVYAVSLKSGNINNNLYYNKAATRLVYIGGVTYTAADYKNINGSADESYNLQPPFIYYNAATDSYNLALSTPCFNVYGINLGTQVEDDIKGNAREFIPTIGAYEFVKKINDLSVPSFLPDPAVLYCPSASYDLKYVVRNEGSNTVSNYIAGYSNNNAAALSMNRTTPLIPCATDTVTFSGASQVNYATRNALTMFTRNPNNSTDGNADNDTLRTSQYSALSGDYVIGTAPSDFLSFREAISMLNKMGVCGKVNMLVKTGLYEEYINLDSLKGTSLNNAVVFRSQAGHADSVILRNTTQGIYYVVKLRTKASHYVFEYITISTNYVYGGNCIVLEGNASYDTIRNCRMVQPTVSGYVASSVYADNYTGTSLNILNNIMEGGHYGIYLVSPGRSYPIKELVIAGNVVSGFGKEFLNCQNTRGGRISNNIFNVTSSSSLAQTATFNYNDSGFKFMNNIINVGAGKQLTWTTFASYNSAQNRFLFSNNVLRGAGRTDFDMGSSCNNVDVIHNSLNCNSGTVQLSCNANTYGMRVLNNVITGSGSYALYYSSSTTSANVTSDYNLVYSSTGNTPYYYSAARTSAAFKSLYYPLEANSVNVPAGLTSTADLAPNPSNASSWAINGKGMFTGYTFNDFNGIPRPQNFAAGAPDIGAYEFTPLSVPQALTAVPLSPVPGGVQAFLQGSDTIAKIKWNAAVPASIAAREYSGVYPPATSGSTHKALNMYWDLTAPAGTYSYDISLYYRYPLRGSIPSIANMIGAKKNGTNPWTFYQGAAVSIDSARNILTIKGLTDFSIFTGTDQADPLPVKLLEFNGVAENNAALLQWKTATEKNTSHFEIHAADDGVNYEQVSGKISAKGNTASLVAYGFRDENAFEKVATRYYRLRSVDADGSYSWSNTVIISANKALQENIMVYPNPFNKGITLHVNNELPTRVTITNLEGKVLYDEITVPQNKRMEIKGLEWMNAGVYFINVKSGNETWVKKLVKN